MGTPRSGRPAARTGSERRAARRPAPRGAYGALLLLLAAAAGAGFPAASAEPPSAEPSGGIPLAAPGDPAWEPLEFPSIDRHTRYTAVDSAGRKVWRAVSECSSSGMVLPLDGVSLDATPMLSWRWRVDRQPTGADERSKAGDDFAARIYVVLRLDPERAAAMSLFERMRRRVGERLYGREMPGSSLNYVWAREAVRGSDWPNPYDPANHMLALRSGEAPLARWTEESVDLVADYRRTLGSAGSPAPTALAIAIMSDSDDTCSGATAHFGDLLLHARPQAR